MTRIRRRIGAAAVAVATIATAGSAVAGLTGGATVTQAISTATVTAPTALTSSQPSGSAGTVALSWGPSTSPAITSQVVERASAEGGPYTTLATLPPTTASLSDATATYNAERYYRVQAQQGTWSGVSTSWSSHSRPMASGVNRVGGSGAGTALSGPWTTAGTDLGRLATADGSRYQPTAWPAAPANMFGASYLDATHAWTSGNGAITFFDGTSWTTQNPGTTAALDQIMFVDTSNGWAVGSGGTIIRTSNGGTTWTAQTSGTTRALREIDCVSTTFCVTVGQNDTVLVTTNGGTTWTDRSPGSSTRMWDVDCVSTSVCWIVGANGVIRKTTDGGTTWTTQASGVTGILRGVWCLSTTTCWVVGANGVLRRTTDGGATWTAGTTGTTATLTSVVLVSGTTAYITGTGSLVRKTTDGGATWTAQTVPAAGYLSVSCFTADDCLTVSDLGTGLITRDGGAHWGEQAARFVELTPLTPNLAAGTTVAAAQTTFTYRTTGVPGAGTRFILMASNDDGLNWSTYDLPTPAAANTDATGTVDLMTLDFADPSSAAHVKLRFAVIPQGGALTVQMDLAHLNVN